MKDLKISTLHVSGKYPNEITECMRVLAQLMLSLSLQ